MYIVFIVFSIPCCAALFYNLSLRLSLYKEVLHHACTYESAGDHALAGETPPILDCTIYCTVPRIVQPNSARAMVSIEDDTPIYALLFCCIF